MLQLNERLAFVIFIIVIITLQNEFIDISKLLLSFMVLLLWFFVNSDSEL